MNKTEIDGFRRITKKTARRLFAQAYREQKELSPVYIIPRGYRINNQWQPQDQMKTHFKEEALIMFEPMVMAFEHYYKKADFYLKQSDLEATPQEER